jgi:carbamoyltransferase
LNILGVNFYQHNSSAALVIDGKVIAAVEEERFTRIKNDGSVPLNAIEYCLKTANLGNINSIDVIVVGLDFHRLLKEKYLQYSLDNFPTTTDLLLQNVDNFKKLLGAENEFREKSGYNGKIEYAKHHLAHMASSYYLSGFQDSALVSADGLGEIESTAIGIAKGKDIKIVESQDFPHSLGLLYQAVTRYLGYNSGSEGTVMALASFGNYDALIDNDKENRTYKEVFEDMFTLKNDALFELNFDYFNFHKTKVGWVSDKFTDIFGMHKEYKDEVTSHHQNIAAALQYSFETIYTHIVNRAIEISGSTNVSIAGGCALNCVANGKIKENTKATNLYIQPAANDAGTAIGAALYKANEEGEELSREFFDITYFGPEFSNEEIEAILKEKGVEYTYVEDPSKEAAKLLNDKKVIGWFQGRMEFGPRALGNRSILGNPKYLEIKDHINANVKHREAFRPFAPSVLAEYSDELFILDQDSPFMLIACNVKPDQKERLRSVMHVDESARIQLVTKDRNERYYNLIKEFNDLSGIPVVLNTSFNDKGEPIVCTPYDALKTLSTTNLDALVIGNFLVKNN